MLNFIRLLLLSYLSLKSKNMVKFCVYISPIFSCQVTNVDCSIREYQSINMNVLLEDIR